MSDLLFLALVVLVSTTPYLRGLGFYSDDWGRLALLSLSADQSIIGLTREQILSNPNLRMRPTQALYQAILFRAFGLTPLGYHIVNALILLSCSIVLFLVLREISTERTFALAVATLYVLLPNYSTSRFWFAAAGHTLSTGLFLLSVYCFLRAVRARLVIAWALSAIAAMTAAVLALETVIPLAIALPPALWWWSKRRYGGGLIGRVGPASSALLMAGPVAAAAVVIFFKATVSAGSMTPDVRHAMRLSIGALAVNFGTYGIGLPHTVAWAVRQLPWTAVGLGAGLGLVVFAYLATRDAPPSSARFWRISLLAGFVIFVLGTAIFLVTGRIQFWSVGIANRVWTAAGLGIALMWVSVSGWVTTRMARGVFHQRIFCAVVAGLCVSGFAINTAVSAFWVASWPRQLQVLGDLRRALPRVTSPVTVILHDVCPYMGPAIVFESHWDFAGALQVMYRNSALRGDVTSGRFFITEHGLSTRRLYKEPVFHPYGRDLVLFTPRRGTLVTLTDAGVARAQLAAGSTCPDGAPNRGTVLLPFDSEVARLFQAVSVADPP